MCSKGLVYLAVFVDFIKKEIASAQKINEIGLVDSHTVARLITVDLVEINSLTALLSATVEQKTTDTVSEQIGWTHFILI